jgi:hypothetical protein
VRFARGLHACAEGIEMLLQPRRLLEHLADGGRKRLDRKEPRRPGRRTESDQVLQAQAPEAVRDVGGRDRHHLDAVAAGRRRRDGTHPLDDQRLACRQRNGGVGNRFGARRAGVPIHHHLGRIVVHRIEHRTAQPEWLRTGSEAESASGTASEVDLDRNQSSGGVNGGPGFDAVVCTRFNAAAAPLR